MQLYFDSQNRVTKHCAELSSFVQNRTTHPNGFHLVFLSNDIVTVSETIVLKSC